MAHKPRPSTVDGRYSHVSPNIVRRASTYDSEFATLAPTQVVDAPLGDEWLWALWKETLGRNMAIAGALALQYAMGRADAEIDYLRLQPRTKTLVDCAHQSLAEFTRVRVCTVCLRAIDRVAS